MFVDYQTFAGLWRCYFVGKWFVALQCKTIHFFIKCLQGHEFVVKGYLKNPHANIGSPQTMIISQ